MPSRLHQLAGGAVAGVVAGATMYIALAAVALTQGRTALYPAYAVEALMSGRRVLPDHPVATLDGRHASDVILGPAMFLLPAVAVGVVVAWWLGRAHGGGRDRDHGLPRLRTVLAPAAVLTAALFVVLVLMLGFHTSEPAVQRLSSGYGVRQLGLPAWVVAHVVYVAVLTVAFGPAVHAVAHAGRGRPEARRLRGDPAGD